MNDVLYRHRGVWKDGETYIYNETYCDIVAVEIENEYVFYQVKTFGTSIYTNPLIAYQSDSNWKLCEDFKQKQKYILLQNSIEYKLGFMDGINIINRKG